MLPSWQDVKRFTARNSGSVVGGLVAVGSALWGVVPAAGASGSHCNTHGKHTLNDYETYCTTNSTTPHDLCESLKHHGDNMVNFGVHQNTATVVCAVFGTAFYFTAYAVHRWAKGQSQYETLEANPDTPVI